MPEKSYSEVATAFMDMIIGYMLGMTLTLCILMFILSVAGKVVTVRVTIDTPTQNNFIEEDNEHTNKVSP